ncbi:MAG: YggS family pyridoxal phosphate-dependent enzyme [Ruminococcaceae bacterium]|nr:YggS family pyridoxal phosphate-dependent enzyme [Oscillospiraceae bacterium]MBQ9912763.1 YggS family pyridoxal phosphate-dependent enzyme [Clostridia bacterium]
MGCLSVDERFKNIDYNIAFIKERIAEAAVKSSRSYGDIDFMAVTKTVEPIFINRAIENGLNLIGENKVQELLSKKPYLNLDKCEANLIGHLQTNKVRQIVGEVSLIESVDSLKLASEISKRSVAKDLVTECLIEVNIGGENSKTGISVGELDEMLCQIAEMPGIKVCGLMTIPPICDNDAELFKYFSKMHKIFIDIKDKKLDNTDISILSMGMSGDYEQAILCGSNHVRIGSAIFGPRLY